MRPVFVLGWVFVWLVLVSSLAAIYVFPLFRLPKPTGPMTVGTRRLHLVDEARSDDDLLWGKGEFPSGKRELMVQVWYPAAVSGQKRAAYRRSMETTRASRYQTWVKTDSYQDAPVDSRGVYPVLLFSPAWTGQRTQSTFLMQELASHGFVVVAIDHTYFSGKVEFPDGRVVDAARAPDVGNFENSTVEAQAELGARCARIESDDQVFVLNELKKMNADAASEWHGRLDTEHAGALGHSLGGAAAVETARRDGRIRAALNLDGWTFGEAGTTGLAKPLMLMYEGPRKVWAATPERLNSVEARDRMFWEFQQMDTENIDRTLQENGGVRMYIAGANHLNFTDRVLYSPLKRFTGGGSIDPRRGMEIIDAYAVAFFSRWLKGTEEKLLSESPSRFAEVDVEVYPMQGEWTDVQK